MQKLFHIFRIVILGLFFLAPQIIYGQLKLGDKYAGGLVFYLDETGKYGKVCSERDIGYFKWDDAFVACEEYNEGGYTDWYLPSKSELNLIYINIRNEGFGGFRPYLYWSSTAITNSTALVQSFISGNHAQARKTNSRYVRAIRKFQITELEEKKTMAAIELKSHLDSVQKDLHKVTWKETSNFGTFKDSRDGKVYKAVIIGKQVWMAENLAYKPSSGNVWAYNNDQSNVAKYGYLYDFQTACNVCPAGWHLPSDAEWTQLVGFLGGEFVAGKKMKSTSGWNRNGNGTNESGLSGLPGGTRSYGGTFTRIGNHLYWWSSTKFQHMALVRIVGFNDGDVAKRRVERGLGFSVRCLRD